MTDVGPYTRLLAALGRQSTASERAAAALEDFAHAAAHLLPDDQVEAMNAGCRECGAVTVGVWQHGGGGRRLRVPSEHTSSAPPWTGKTCPGSFAAAILTTTPEKGPRK